MKVFLVSILALLQTGPDRTPRPQLEFLHLGKSRLILVGIPSGKFWMGTNQIIATQGNWTNDAERPVHQVTISRDFWMGQFPVTQRQWQEVMGDNPSYCKDAGPEAPVEQVTWNRVQAFLAKVNVSQHRWKVRLPTEAEWEYAARAGTTGERYGPLDEIAWYKANGSGTTHPVGKKLPNAFGLYDMLGNVWQWCQDRFGAYPAASVVDPQGPTEGERRATRGGCYYCDAIHERAARRNRDLTEHSWRSIGFRIVATPRTDVIILPRPPR
jgi:formylglycine-generating enzyme required for sulfatase activity